MSKSTNALFPCYASLWLQQHFSRLKIVLFCFVFLSFCLKTVGEAGSEHSAACQTDGFHLQTARHKDHEPSQQQGEERSTESCGPAPAGKGGSLAASPKLRKLQALLLGGSQNKPLEICDAEQMVHADLKSLGISETRPSSAPSF